MRTSSKIQQGRAPKCGWVSISNISVLVRGLPPHYGISESYWLRLCVPFWVLALFALSILYFGQSWVCVLATPHSHSGIPTHTVPESTVLGPPAHLCGADQKAAALCTRRRGLGRGLISETLSARPVFRCFRIRNRQFVCALCATPSSRERSFMVSFSPNVFLFTGHFLPENVFRPSTDRPLTVRARCLGHEYPPD